MHGQNTNQGGIVFKRSLATAGTVVAAAALITGGANLGAQADNDAKAAPPKVAKAATTTACDGGKQKHSWDRGVRDFFGVSDQDGASLLPGSNVKVKGPSHGKDVLSVNVSAGTYLDNGAYGQVKVLLNGSPMKPSDNVDGSWFYGPTNYGDFARNYCAKIGPGNHSLRVVLEAEDIDGTADSFYLQDAMLHAELSD